MEEEAVGFWLRVFKTVFKGVPKVAKKFSKNKEPYYYKEYNKKVFIKRNGNGIIVASLLLWVNNKESTEGIIRTFDISDAKEGTKFPDFDTLLENGEKMDLREKTPFEDYGLWCWSEGDIVTDIIKKYDKIDKPRKNDPRFLSFKMILNKAALEKNKSYRITYALSVPGLYPISNGYFSGTKEDHEKYGSFQTSINTYLSHDILKYSVYIEKGIVFSEKPQGYFVDRKKQGELVPNSCNYKDNMFYEKFDFTVAKPQIYDKIYMEWDLKNKK